MCDQSAPIAERATHLQQTDDVLAPLPEAGWIPYRRTRRARALEARSKSGGTTAWGSAPAGRRTDGGDTLAGTPSPRHTLRRVGGDRLGRATRCTTWLLIVALGPPSEPSALLGARSRRGGHPWCVEARSEPPSQSAQCRPESSRAGGESTVVGQWLWVEMWKQHCAMPFTFTRFESHNRAHRNLVLAIASTYTGRFPGPARRSTVIAAVLRRHAFLRASHCMRLSGVAWLSTRSCGHLCVAAFGVRGVGVSCP